VPKHCVFSKKFLSGWNVPRCHPPNESRHVNIPVTIVAPDELAKISIQYPAIRQRDATVRLDDLDRDRFTIDQLAIFHATAMGIDQLQLVAGGQGSSLR